MGYLQNHYGTGSSSARELYDCYHNREVNINICSGGGFINSCFGAFGGCYGGHWGGLGGYYGGYMMPHCHGGFWHGAGHAVVNMLFSIGNSFMFNWCSPYMGGGYSPSSRTYLDSDDRAPRLERALKNNSKSSGEVDKKPPVGLVETDKDLEKINKFRERLQALQAEAADATEISNDLKSRIEALKAEIEAAKANHEDKINEEDNNTAFDQLLADIEKIKAGKAETEPPTPTVDDKKIGDKLISDYTLDDINAITQDNYNNLTDGQKTNLKAKIKELNEDDRVALAQNNSIPQELRIAAKEAFYKNGYVNVNISDLTNEELQKLIDVTDTSEIGDFTVKSVDIDSIQRDGKGKILSFKMTSTTNKNVTYTYVNVVDNELIFHGAQEGQQYVLQKEKCTKDDGTEENKYHLMQYPYHQGQGTADVKG